MICVNICTVCRMCGYILRLTYKLIAAFREACGSSWLRCFHDTEDPSTQHLRFLVPKFMTPTVFGTSNLKDGVLGLKGLAYQAHGL